jgi:hypothetical protein
MIGLLAAALRGRAMVARIAAIAIGFAIGTTTVE